VAGVLFWSMPTYTHQSYAQHFAPLSTQYIKHDKSQTKSWITAFEAADFPTVIENLSPCLEGVGCEPFYDVYLGVAYLKTGQLQEAADIFQQVKMSQIHVLRKIVAQYYFACTLLEQGKIEVAKNELAAIADHQKSSVYTKAAAQLLNTIEQ
ncbi:MAG: hypothetical protein AAF985_21940, partial [Bacteroidota bacterium]